MRKLQYLICLSLVFFFVNAATCHDKDVHKYLTDQAWQLVKYYHPEVQYSDMNSHMGGWQDGSLNGTSAWQTAKIMTGAYREDEEDVVYNRDGLIEFGNATDTHFWDGWGDETLFHPPPYLKYYPNSYSKVMTYWNGQIIDPSNNTYYTEFLTNN